MKNWIKFSMILAMAVLFLACSEDNVTPETTTVEGNSANVNCTCLDDFSHLVGGPWSVGDVILTSPCVPRIGFRQFQFSNGVWTAAGFARIEPAPVSYMSGKTIFTGNTNVQFELPCTVDGLCIQVADFGGNLNIRINGVFVNFNDFSDIDGAVIGGVTVKVTYTPGGNAQRICLHGPVSEFAVGGQELFLDNLCLGPCI